MVCQDLSWNTQARPVPLRDARLKLLPSHVVSGHALPYRNSFSYTTSGAQFAAELLRPPQLCTDHPRTAGAGAAQEWGVGDGHLAAQVRSKYAKTPRSLNSVAGQGWWYFLQYRAKKCWAPFYMVLKPG